MDDSPARGRGPTLFLPPPPPLWDPFLAKCYTVGYPSGSVGGLGNRTERRGFSASGDRVTDADPNGLHVSVAPIMKFKRITNSLEGFCGKTSCQYAVCSPRKSSVYFRECTYRRTLRSRTNHLSTQEDSNLGGWKHRDPTSFLLPYPPERWGSSSRRRSFSHLCNYWVGGTQSSPTAR